jgi:hypothetical protein
MACDGMHMGTLVEFANFLISVRCNYKLVRRRVSLSFRLARVVAVVVLVAAAVVMVVVRDIA